MYDDFEVPFDTEEFKEDADILSELYDDGPHEGLINEVTANYYVGIVKQNKEKEAVYKEQAKNMIDDFTVKVQGWLAKRQRALDYSTQMCLGKLEAFYRANQPANGKSISLPEGHIGFYKVKEKYDFDTNKNDVIKILSDTPELNKFLRYTPAVDKINIRKACSFKDGIVYVDQTPLPGVTYTPETQEFRAK